MVGASRPTQSLLKPTGTPRPMQCRCSHVILVYTPSVDGVPQRSGQSEKRQRISSMIKTMTNLVAYRELMLALAWKNISVRFKQAYLGITWAILKPLMLVLIFTLVKSFVGIDSGDIPYPVLTFAALMPWIFFQEAASVGVYCVVGNANLIRKIYFPSEIFQLFFFFF